MFYGPIIVPIIHGGGKINVNDPIFGAICLALVLGATLGVIYGYIKKPNYMEKWEHLIWCALIGTVIGVFTPAVLGVIYFAAKFVLTLF